MSVESVLCRPYLFNVERMVPQGHKNRSNDRRSDSPTELTTKRFHLSIDLKQEIEERAESNYCGNTAQLIRAAIQDHIHTLDGDSDRQVAQLAQEVKELKEQIDELNETIRGGRSPQSDSQAGSLSEVDRSPSDSEYPKDDSAGSGECKTAVYSALESTGTDALTLTQLSERTDEPIVNVAAAAEELASRGLLNQRQNDDTRTYLINTA